MEQVCFTAALWLLLVLLAVLAAHWTGISTALSEIVVGTVAQLALRTLLGRGAAGARAQRNLAGADEPVVVVFVDNSEAVDRLIAAVEPMIDTGMIAVSAVDVIRVQKPSDAGSFPRP